MAEIKTDIIFEKGWDHTCIHVDIPQEYEEDYQMKMLKYNDLDGILQVTGIGREGQSRYTFQTMGGISLAKKYENRDIKKEAVETLTEQIMDIADELKEYMLDPDCVLLSPEFIFEKDGKYWFCYLPIVQKPLYRSFHELTEFFVSRLDYRDTEGIFLSHMLHRETLQDTYSLRKILEDYRRDKEKREEESKEKQGKEAEQENSLSEGAVFTLDEEIEENRDKERLYDVRPDAMKLGEEKKGYGTVKKLFGKIKTGRWGNWQDLITEIDGQDGSGQL